MLACAISSPGYASQSKHKKKPARAPIAAPRTENRHFEHWPEVLELIKELQNQNQFDPDTLKKIFEQTRFLEASVQLMKPAPPGQAKNWKAYRTRFVENGRINAGLAFWERNQSQLAKAEQEYGVPPEIIVGLIGVETIYGKNMGSYRVIDSLTTLAFAYPDTPTREARMRYFRNELMQFLIWTRDTHIDPLLPLGSYAGAIGLAQFMPSSLRVYAVDFDADGKIDLRGSEADAIASVANYLALHGWQRGPAYVYPATLKTNESDAEQIDKIINRELKANYAIDELLRYVSSTENSLPKQAKYGLIDLQNGDDPSEYWLVTNNFYALTQYNRSFFYAMSIVDLSNVIAQTRKNTE